MKSLQEFKDLFEEEKEDSDYSKFDMLVRAGLANKAQLQRIHRILDKMKEERPTFNNADRMILQNLFNKMVDVLTQNKQIFQQTRRVVREEGEILEEGVGDPPFVLVLKRKAIRLYPDNTRIALYYNDKLGKYFSVPYSDAGVNSPIQAEEVEVETEMIEEEHVMDSLHKIAKGSSKQRVKFASGHTRTVDSLTAHAVVNLHNALNDENKKKLRDMVHKSPEHLGKVADFAFKKSTMK